MYDCVSNICPVLIYCVFTALHNTWCRSQSRGLPGTVGKTRLEDYSETVSRGFFVPKKTAPGEETKVRLVADFRGVNLRLQRPEYPLDSSSSILKRLNPGDRFFAAIDMSSGYSQIPLDEDSRNMFTIILPQGKYRFCVLPQGLSVSPSPYVKREASK